MDIFICIVSVALGFAFACLIFAVLLSGSNDIGNSTGLIEDYKTDISFEVSEDLEYTPLILDEVDLFCTKYSESLESGVEEPDPDKLVEKISKEKIKLEDITAIYVDG